MKNWPLVLENGEIIGGGPPMYAVVLQREITKIFRIGI